MQATSTAVNPKDVPQDQHRPLGGGEVPQRGDERQLDALPTQVRRRRVGLGGHGRVARPRLQPDRTGHRLTEVTGAGAGSCSSGTSSASTTRPSCRSAPEPVSPAAS
jgi:hypothetical protein